MKKIWKSPKEHRNGELRCRRVFLLFPHTVYRDSNVNETRWMSWAWMKERYYDQIGFDNERVRGWQFFDFSDGEIK